MDGPAVTPDGEKGMVAGARVLVWGVDVGTRRLVQRILRREGLQVIGCGSGRDTLAVAASEDFSLGLVDVTRPGRICFDLVRSLHALPRFRYTPIIMLIGLEAESDIVRGFELGVSDYVVKPFNRAVLVGRVDRALRHGATLNRES